ncbi:hypothetical protein ElyMa_002592700 [Elysia marginata]|uniref:Reverse transcriptase zinc-binding domain-containing protein n=1 Tax=Elysia marginata TaxID=1093978 RepID=A0AAV4GZU1_9GAST|nr:hypothetical protein ElyMa_002592700 [Elysia marginata]
MQRFENFNATEEWRKEWENNPTQPLPGFTTLKRNRWVITNRLRTRHAKIAYMMHEWKLKDTPICKRCSKAPGTTDHIVFDCLVTKVDGGCETVHNAVKDLIA